MGEAFLSVVETTLHGFEIVFRNEPELCYCTQGISRLPLFLQRFFCLKILVVAATKTDT